MQTAKTVKESVEDARHKMQKALEATRSEFQSIRTGRASIHLVEGLSVNYYGTPTPLKQLASITTPDPKTIVIQPWDHNAFQEIGVAIQKSDLGISPANDGKVYRLAIPPLTEERRGDLTKLVHKVAEGGRVSIRHARHESVEAIKKLEKEKAASEDESFRAQKEVQKLTDDHIGMVDQALAKKESEIKSI